jgi:hypothetical protein
MGVVKLESPVPPSTVIGVATTKISPKSITFNGTQLKLAKRGNLDIYNIAGIRVASLKNVSYVGVGNLKAGVYVAKSGKDVCKFVLK